MSAALQEEGQVRQRTLRALDRLLAVSPPCTAQEAIETMRCATALRDLLVARRRAGEDSPALEARLACVNGVVSLTWSGAVPVTGFRRERLERVRAALAALDGDEDGRSAEA